VGVTPLFHYSESKQVNENTDCNPRAHSDFVYGFIDDFGMTLDIDLEAKAKELSRQQYIDKYGSI
jgi:UV DNA damage repair endonuclease